MTIETEVRRHLELLHNQWAYKHTFYSSSNKLRSYRKIPLKIGYAVCVS